MSQPDILRGYAVEAAELIPEFEAIRTLDVLAPMAAMLPSEPSRVLEIGAGTGRDAAWLVEQSHNVIAVEPVDELREAGMALHPSDKIQWVKDWLPTLHQIRYDSSGFNLILVVAVWQHLLPQDHRQAIRTLAGKVASEGCLIMSLRHGPGSTSRICYPADPDGIIRYAEDAGMRLLMRSSAKSVQQKNRDRGDLDVALFRAGVMSSMGRVRSFPQMLNEERKSRWRAWKQTVRFRPGRADRQMRSHLWLMSAMGGNGR